MSDAQATTSTQTTTPTQNPTEQAMVTTIQAHTTLSQPQAFSLMTELLTLMHQSNAQYFHQQAQRFKTDC